MPIPIGSISTIGFDLLPLQNQMVINTLRPLLLVMSYKDQCLVLSAAEGLDDILHQPTVCVVKAVQRFVEYQQGRVFHKGTSQQNQPLFPA